MLLKRWEPFREIRRMDNTMDRMWRDVFRPAHRWPGYWGTDGRVAVDVYREEDNLVVRAALPGTKPEDLEVTVAENVLTIKGASRDEKEIKEEAYLHREHRTGSFKRTVSLPSDLEAEKAEASFENGILTVTIPRTEGSKPKLLKVNVKAPEGQKS